MPTVGNVAPISVDCLAQMAGVPVEEAQAFFVENFGSYEAYKALCNEEGRTVLAKVIQLLNDSGE